MEVKGDSSLAVGGSGPGPEGKQSYIPENPNRLDPTL